ncbi:MAG TPA: hypothetical protein VHE09_15385 [Rhizomicrobium sp.]|nr:hypothetical protein [Rhizomicrobium sp.]
MSVSLRTIAVCALAAAAMMAGPAQALVHGGYHIMPTQQYLEKHSKDIPPPSGQVFYYGGSVFTSVRVVNVIWGKDVNPAIATAADGLSDAMVQSTYLDQMSIYSTKGAQAINGHKSTKQVIGRGSYFGQITIKPKNTSTTLTDDDVQAELKHQIKKGKLPVADLNTLYMIYFPRSVSISLDGLQSCIDFGAYHFATNDLKLSKNNVFYTVEPDCGSQINSVTFAASHEFAEATTDNVPTPGSFPDFPQAWNDANGYEVGDKCSGSGTLTKGSNHWTVTQYWLTTNNGGNGGCSTGNYTSP